MTKAKFTPREIGSDVDNSSDTEHTLSYQNSEQKELDSEESELPTLKSNETATLLANNEDKLHKIDSNKCSCAIL